MNYSEIFQNQLTALRTEGRYRQFAELERPLGMYPRARWFQTPDAEPKEVVIWCSNDYLSMGHHPVVLTALHQAVDTGATGAGGTRNIAGTHHAHVQLEQTLALLHSKEAALLFTSGYSANQTALASLGLLLEDCVILSDDSNHNSMIEGIKRSGARKIIFKHNDLADLEQHLLHLPLAQPKIIAFESVYSMSGSIAPIPKITALARKYQALTYLDEVHAVGMYGALGGGVAQEMGVADEVDIIQGTLGKAFGLSGGYISASKEIVDCVRSFGNGFIFSTSLPPMIAAAAKASVTHLMGSSSERAQQREAVRRLRAALKQAGIPNLANDSHIVPVMVGDAFLAKAASDRLLTVHGIYVQPINYPTVARGTERLRFTPGPKHTQELIDQLVTALSEIWAHLKLPRL
ncbi:MAG: 5-aminolevulinate synthase [Pseudomonadota bacterium]|jgi:5-aminolevulinate synthase